MILSDSVGTVYTGRFVNMSEHYSLTRNTMFIRMFSLKLQYQFLFLLNFGWFVSSKKKNLGDNSCNI